jgi:hypothetical protein
MLFNLKLLPPEIIKAIKNSPRDIETVGIIRGDTIIIPEQNGTPKLTKLDTSLLQPGDIIYHTHILESQNGFFSHRDICTAKVLKKYPILLYHTDFDCWDYFDPAFYHPYPLNLSRIPLTFRDYIDIPYTPIRCDCYSFAKDVMKGLFNKDIPDIYENSVNVQSLYESFQDVTKLGFQPIDEIKNGCLLHTYISQEIPNHVVVVIDASIGLCLHQQRVKSEIIYYDTLKSNIIDIYEFPSQEESTPILSYSYTPIPAPI